MKVLKLFMASAILLLSSSCAIYHHYGPYYGKVVDEETKQPLEGAVVLAEYVTVQYMTPGGGVQYFLDAQETITDKNGEFHIPSLNAFAFRAMSSFDSNPGFTIFKPRYKCYTGSSKFMPNYTLPVDQSVTVELQHLRTNDERLKYTGCYPGLVPYKKMEKLIRLYNVERSELGLEPEFKREMTK